MKIVKREINKFSKLEDVKQLLGCRISYNYPFKYSDLNYGYLIGVKVNSESRLSYFVLSDNLAHRWNIDPWYRKYHVFLDKLNGKNVKSAWEVNYINLL